MYFSISQYCFEFVSYLLLLCVISVILSLIIGPWGILLFILFFIMVISVLYLFRYNNTCPANLIVNHKTCLWPSDGTIISLSHGTFFRLTGHIIEIESRFFDCYTHVAPICGSILKMIITDKQHQYSNAIYIQIDNENYSIDMIIYANDSVFASSSAPILLINEGDYVYASQPLCLSMFGARVKFVIEHHNKIDLSKLYVGQSTYISYII